MPRVHRVAHGPLSHLLLCSCAVRGGCWWVTVFSAAAVQAVQSAVHGKGRGEASPLP